VFPSDFWNNGSFFFGLPESYDEKVVNKKWNSTAVETLSAYADTIQDNKNLSPDDAKLLLNNLLEEKGVKLGQVMQALRLAITGKGSGPDLMEIISILGGPEVHNRISHARSSLPVTST
jgi:glutamyl-tRNA synthetase